MVQFKLLSGVLWEIEWDQTDPLRCLALLTKACFVSLTCGFILHVNAGQNGTDDNNAVDQAEAGRTTRACESRDYPSRTNVSQENTTYNSFNLIFGSGPDAKAEAVDIECSH